MRKLKELWQLVKGICKDRTPYIVVYNGGNTLAFVDSDKFGGKNGVFVGNWDGAYEYMRHVSSRNYGPCHECRIAIAGDVPELRGHFMLKQYYN